jgi:hypothetical protein
MEEFFIDDDEMIEPICEPETATAEDFAEPCDDDGPDWDSLAEDDLEQRIIQRWGIQDDQNL